MTIELTEEEKSHIIIDIQHILKNIDLNSKSKEIRQSILSKLDKEEYISFTWEDRHLFRGKYVRSKGDFKKEFIVGSITEEYAFGSVLYKDAFEYFEFVDGSVFGKLK